MKNLKMKKIKIKTPKDSKEYLKEVRRLEKALGVTTSDAQSILDGHLIEKNIDPMKF